MPTIQLSNYCLSFITFVLLSRVSPALATDQMPPARSERELIEILQTKPPAEKAIACKQLAIYGGKEAVPELAKLLADEELSSWSRIALEAIPGPEADAALLNATDTLKGQLLVGTINSIGVRKSAKAVDRLTTHLKDQDTEAASAAAVALGRIGNDAATKTLRQSLSSTAGPLRSAVAEGCILCAERLAAEGKSKEAAELFDEVRKADVPKPRVLEATRGAILARNEAGIPLLLEQLNSSDKGHVQIGLSTARQLAGRDVADKLAVELPRIAPPRAALLLNALADRSDATLPRAVVDAAKRGDKQVRIAAISVIGRLGDASSVPALLEVAAENDVELAQAATSALAVLPTGEKVDGELVNRLSNADGKVLAALIHAVGERRIPATAPLIKAVNHQDAAIRQAALTALGETVSPKEVSVLISQVVEPKHADEAEVASRALRAACVRMPDREACAAELAAAMPRASTPTKARLIEILGAMGGPKALDTIGTAAKSSDAALQDAGTRVLGEWMTVDAGPVLLDLAKKQSGNKYQGRALRGYIRLARQFAMPDGQRAEMCQNALDASDRAEDQKLILAVLERYPSVDTLKVAVKAAAIPEIKEDASKAAMVIAQKVGGDNADVRDQLAKIGLKPVKVEIVKAEYGSEAQRKDVTAVLQKQARDLPLITLASPKYNDSFGGDPEPGAPKVLVVEYRIDGKAGDASFVENAIILLPMPK